MSSSSLSEREGEGVEPVRALMVELEARLSLRCL